MTIHAFALKGALGKGDLATACGLLFPSHLRVSSPKDMPAGDKVSSESQHVDCPECHRLIDDIYHTEVRNNGHLAGRKFRFCEDGRIVEITDEPKPQG